MPFELTDLGQLRILAQVAIAMLLGGVIGYEREMAHKPAGLRTHMLLSGGAALLAGLGNVIVSHYDLQTSGPVLRSDPLRVLEAIITGVSFLGAGSIIRERGEEVAGLTTGASLLLTAGVGVCVAVGQILTALGITGLALVVLRILVRLERALGSARGK